MPLSRSRGHAAAMYLLLLVPLLHPLLLPLVGVPSHLLWFAHVLPVAWATYHHGVRRGMLLMTASLALLAAGERSLGAGYFVAADWQTTIALAVAVTFTNALVAGFAAYARRARSLQEQLWQSQKMETLGLFAASVAHDFNNMLTAITLSTELALQDSSTDDPVREHLAEVLGAAERAALLCKRLLSFSRRDVSSASELDAAEVVRNLEVMLRRLIPRRVDLDVVTEAAPLVLGDRGHLEQIVLNLVVNAGDAILNHGTITVAVRQAHEHELPNAMLAGADQYVLVEVADTGMGMDSALQRRIFDPLFTTKPAGKGTGLGLSTVRDLVAAFHGRVTVASRPGHGSIFRVLLPASLHQLAPVPSDGEPKVRLAS